MQLEKVRALVEGFENGTLPKQEWTHAAHFVMALWYCVKYPLPEAVGRIREGIKKYNVSVGGKNTDVSGYHETITLFYITSIANYLVTTGVKVLTDEQLAIFLQQPFLAKDYAHRFYSTERLMSREARSVWAAPDRMPHPTLPAPLPYV